MALNTVLHFIALSHHIFTMWYDLVYVDFTKFVPTLGLPLKGRSRYLTFWNLILQAVFFTVCFLNDLSNKDREKIKSTKLGKLQDTLMTCLAFPLSMFVGLTFWSLYLFDRELVLPKAVDEFFPSWLNHFMHTNIMVFILIEMFTAERQYPTRRFGLTVLTSFMLVYLVWVHVIFAYTGYWVYPVLDVLNLPLRIVFFGTLLGLAMLLYILGEKLNKFIWGAAPTTPRTTAHNSSRVITKETKSK